MSAFDRVIGYEDIKRELIMMCDVLRNPEKYKKLGVVSPRGVMLYGDPGLGKTLMALCFVEESGRESFVIRKNRSNGDFVNHIRETFEKAKKNAPAVVLLDDFDRFADTDEWDSNAEEYITVQACIDSVSNSDVFVIATANKIRTFPKSIMREGRIDEIIEVEKPRKGITKDLISFYLSDKTVSDDVDVEELARLLEGETCATLETVMNEAGIYAGYKDKAMIDHKDIIHACFRSVYGISSDSYNKNNKERRCLAIHEAGHALVSEIQWPDSVNIVSIKYGRDSEGITAYRIMGKKLSFDDIKANTVRTLAGKAAIEVVLGLADMGAKGDISSARSEIGEALDDASALGYDTYTGCFDDSWGNRNLQHKITQTMEECYQAAKRIIVENRTFLDAIVEELLEKEIITYKDIARIKEEVNKSLRRRTELEEKI